MVVADTDAGGAIPESGRRGIRADSEAVVLVLVAEVAGGWRIAT